MTKEEKAVMIANQCKPCTDDFYSGIKQGVLLALVAEEEALEIWQQHVNFNQTKKISFKSIASGSEIYSDQFSKEGWFVVDQIDLRPNNKVTDKKLVAVVKAHLREEPDFKVEATSDNFHF